MSTPEINEIRRLLDALIRSGTVDQVDAVGGTVRVRWPSGVVSQPMPWAVTSASFYAEPVAGDQAIVLTPGGAPGGAIALCGVASTDAARGNKSEAARADLVASELNALKDAYNVHTHGSPQAASGNLLTSVPSSTPAGSPPDFQYTPDSNGVGATFVKVD